MSGTIRGDVVRFDDYEQREVGGILAPSNQFTLEHVVVPGQTGDRNAPNRHRDLRALTRSVTGHPRTKNREL